MAMALIERINVTSNSNLTYTFSNIPQTYKDLLVISTNQSAGSGVDSMFMRINGDTGTGYSQILFRYTQSIGTDGTYITPGSYVFTSISPGATSYNNFYGGATIYFPNYTNASIAKGWNVKTGVSTNVANSSSSINLIPGQSTVTGAITSITFSGYGLYPTSNTTFSLYGIS
jgi:hypothetical protein